MQKAKIMDDKAIGRAITRISHEIIERNKEQIADETLADKKEKGEGETELDINGEKVKIKLVRLA